MIYQSRDYGLKTDYVHTTINRLIMFNRLLAIITLTLLTSIVTANDFSFSHQDQISDNFRSVGQRQWLIQDQRLTVNSQSNAVGFLIYDQTIGQNGQATVHIDADSWSGQNGGLVMRWTSESDYMFIAVRPENDYSSQLFFCINTMHTEKSEDCHILSKSFSASNEFKLEVLAHNANYTIFVDDKKVADFSDTRNTNGSIGYAYYNAWESYTRFIDIAWQDHGNAPDPAIAKVSKQPPLTLTWLGRLAKNPDTANENDAYFNSTDRIIYLFSNHQWTSLEDSNQ